MLIDEYLPEYDFVEKHVTRVRAKASEVFRAVNDLANRGSFEVYPDSRKKFGFYRTFVQPLSGLIRMEMLKAIKRRAELGV